MYYTPNGFLVPPEPEAPLEEADVEEQSRNPQRLHRRRLETALNTLRRNLAKYPNNDDIAANVGLLDTLSKATASMKAFLRYQQQNTV